MSGPNPGVGDQRVVSVLNHMLLSLCSITHVPCVKQTTAILYVTCFRGKQEFQRTGNKWRHTHSNARESTRNPHARNHALLRGRFWWVNSGAITFFNPTPPPPTPLRQKNNGPSTKILIFRPHSSIWMPVRGQRGIKWRMIIAVYIRNFCSCEKKAWKKFSLVRDSSPWPLRYRCSALYQLS